MASRTCWYCTTHAHMTPIANPVKGKQTWWRPYTCDNCAAISIAHIPAHQLHDTHTRPITDIYQAQEHWPHEITNWQPQQPLGKKFNDVPDPIATAASEAYACYTIRSYRAAILLARAVVEAAAKQQGITQGNLATKIDTLEQKRIIKPLTKDTAHEIRYLGNNMAHGDFITEVTEDEADDVLNFMTTFLEEIYQQPARLSRFKDKRHRAGN